VAKKFGRRKGSRNKGYFYRAGRGWVVKHLGRFVALTDDQGVRLRDKNLRDAEVKAAYERWIREQKPPLEEAMAADPTAPRDAYVGMVCAKYLEDLRSRAGNIGQNPRGLAKTYIDRSETLFDFCHGFAAEYFCGGDREARERKMEEKPPKKIHTRWFTKAISVLITSSTALPSTWRTGSAFAYRLLDSTGKFTSPARKSSRRRQGPSWECRSASGSSWLAASTTSPPSGGTRRLSRKSSTTSKGALPLCSAARQGTGIRRWRAS
jgi:hypothetical protein